MGNESTLLLLIPSDLLFSFLPHVPTPTPPTLMQPVQPDHRRNSSMHKAVDGSCNIHLSKARIHVCVRAGCWARHSTHIALSPLLYPPLPPYGALN